MNPSWIKYLNEKLSHKSNIVKNSEAERLLLAGVEIPEPVFFCTIEPPSMAKQPGTNSFGVSIN